ncbi:esterase/lipase family protein [Streptomyces sp. NPDC102340]|uniref:esterase/lipase family protein n=1 Tax=unclassified Streptomyces TaxID=2593676 RepID=UPI003818A298
MNVHAKTGRQAQAVVVFVHGFTGGGYATWGMWPRLVFDQISEEPLDVATYEYATLHKAWLRRHLGANLHEVASQLADWIRSLHEDNGYRDIYLVTHSLGGLVAEAAVMRYLRSLGTRVQEVTAVAALYLLASPRLGTGLALGPLRGLVPEIEWLRKHSTQAADSEGFMQEHVESSGRAASANHRSYLIPRYSAMAGNDRVVAKMSGLFGVPESQRLQLSGNHRSLVKPDELNQEQHRRLLKIVRSSGENRRAWRRQKRHESHFSTGPAVDDEAQSSLIVELQGDNVSGAIEQAYNQARLSVGVTEFNIYDRRNPGALPSQRTDLLITVQDAKSVVDEHERCREVVRDAFNAYQMQNNLTLLVVPIGPDWKQAEETVKSWLPKPPHRAMSVEGVATLAEFKDLVAQWIDVVVGRDPLRWSRALQRPFESTEGRDFV